MPNNATPPTPQLTEILLEQAIGYIEHYKNVPSEERDAALLECVMDYLRWLQTLQFQPSSGSVVEIPRALQVHLDDFESLRQAWSNEGMPDGLTYIQVSRYEDAIIAYWTNCSWYLPLADGTVLKGETQEVDIDVNLEEEPGTLTLHLSVPWNGLTMVGGPISSFFPVGIYRHVQKQRRERNDEL